MPAYEFDSSGFAPEYGGGGSQLPVGKHPVVIVATELKPTQKGGGFLALTLEAIDGPSKGVQHVDRLNLHNQSAQTVEIANKQLSAYCHVTGVLRFRATEELHGKPFVVDIVSDARPEYPNATKVGKIFDINGNEPAKAGTGQQQGGNFGGNGFGGGQPQGGGFNPGAGQPQGDPNAGHGNGGGNPAGWGQQSNAGQQGGGAAASGAGAWSQGAGGNGAGASGPGWGQR